MIKSATLVKTFKKREENINQINHLYLQSLRCKKKKNNKNTFIKHVSNNDKKNFKKILCINFVIISLIFYTIFKLKLTFIKKIKIIME